MAQCFHCKRNTKTENPHAHRISQDAKRVAKQYLGMRLQIFQGIFQRFISVFQITEELLREFSRTLNRQLLQNCFRSRDCALSILTDDVCTYFITHIPHGLHRDAILLVRIYERRFWGVMLWHSITTNTHLLIFAQDLCFIRTGGAARDELPDDGVTLLR